MIKIMIADDHDLYREVLRDFLNRNGFSVINTTRMDEGFETALHNSVVPDIAIIAFKSSRTNSLADLRWLLNKFPCCKNTGDHFIRRPGAFRRVEGTGR